MRFTKYYSDLIKAQGVPHLNTQQFQLINNIIAIEVRINEQELLGKHLRGDQKVMLEKRNYTCYSKLNNLTKGKAPQEVFKHIVAKEHF